MWFVFTSFHCRVCLTLCSLGGVQGPNASPLAAVRQQLVSASAAELPAGIQEIFQATLWQSKSLPWNINIFNARLDY